MLVDHKILIRHSENPVIVCEYPSLKVLDANLKCKELTGFNLKDIKQKKLSFLFPDGLKRKNTGLIKNSVEEEKTAIKEIPISDIDGNKILCDLEIIRSISGNKEFICIIIQPVKQISKPEKTFNSSLNSEDVEAPMVITDQNHKIIFYNNYAVRIFGWNDKGIIGKNIKLLNPLNFSKEERKKLEQELKEKGTYSGEFTIEDDSGRKKYFDISISRYNDKNSSTFGYIGICTDKTDRKKIIDELKSSEKKYRSLYENNPLMIFIVSPDGIIKSVNETGAKELGYKISELVGSDVTDIFFKEDVNIVKNHLKNCLNNPGKMFSWELRKINKNGKILWVKESASSFGNGDKNNVLIVCDNISLQKEAEKDFLESDRKLKTVISNIPVILFSIDKNGIFTISEGRGLESLGLKSGEVVGTSVFEFYKNYPKIIKAIKDGLKGKTIKSRVDVNNVSFETWISPVYSDGNKINGVIGVAFDITETKDAEKALIDSEKRYRTLAETSHDMIFILDKNVDIHYVNRFAAKQFNLKPEQMTGKNIKDFFPELNYHNQKRSVLKVLETGKSSYIENITYIKNQRVWLSTWLTPMQNDSGEITKVMGVSRDITTQKQYEEELKLSRSRYKTLFETANDGILILKNNKIIDCNAKTGELFGGNINDIIGKTPVELSPVYQPDGKESTDKANEKIYNAYNKDAQYFEWKHKRIDGSLFDVEVSLNKLELDGENYLQAVIRDITERKKSEERLHLLTSALQSAANGIVITDKEGKIQWVNTAFTSLTGYTFDDVVKQSTSILKSGKMDTEFYTNLWDTILNGKVWHNELINKRKDGTTYYEEMTITPVKATGNEITNFIGIKQDITERKKHERELKKAKEKAEEASKIKSNFLANMSHELRTPMVGILGYTEILKDEIKNPDLKDISNNLYESGKRLMETLNLILHLSKIEANKQEIHRTNVNIPDVVRDVAVLFKEIARKKSLYLKTEIKDENLIAYLEERMLRDILNNLVSNALKFTKHGGITIEVFRDNFNGKEWVVIKVIDTGIGISEENKEIIFEEFRQVSEGLSRKFEGTGLGLAITNRFVKMLDGKIEIESKLNEGSTFTVSFPLVKEKTSEKETEVIYEKTDKELIIKESDIELPDVLLVENDVPSQQITKLFLKNICAIDIAVSGREAIEKALNKSYDIIFMDINLGSGITGMETTKEIRKIQAHKNTPIVALTAFVMDGDKEEILSAGCSHYLAKPFTRDEIIQLVSEILNEIK